jgi:hypothetical protein
MTDHSLTRMDEATSLNPWSSRHGDEDVSATLLPEKLGPS